MPPFLRFETVSKRFGGVTALDRVDWDVLPGEVHCLVGENGCGKSTMIKLAAGVHDADPGSIDRHRWRGARAARPGAGQGAGRAGDLPGPVAVSQSVGGRKHRHRRGAGGHWPGRCPGGRCARIASEALGRLGMALPLDAPRRLAAHRVAADRGHRARPCRQGAAAVHGRAHRLAHPHRGEAADRHRHHG